MTAGGNVALGMPNVAWWAKPVTSILIAAAGALAVLVSGLSRLLGSEHQDIANVMLTIGIIVVFVCTISQVAISVGKDKKLSKLTAQVRTAKAEGIEEAMAEVRREIQHLAKLSGRGWNVERSENFQERVVELAYKLLNSVGTPKARVCFFIAMAPEVKPGPTQNEANIQSLASFHHCADSGRHAPKGEHSRSDDKHGMFKLLKDDRADVIDRRKNIPDDHTGWRSAVRVGVIGKSVGSKSKHVPWGVLTADSTEFDAFPQPSVVILELIADLIVMARTAESAAKPLVGRLADTVVSPPAHLQVDKLRSFAREVAPSGSN